MNRRQKFTAVDLRLW